MIVTTDREMINDYFKAKETEMSLYEVLDRIYFGHAFSDNAHNLPMLITMVKKTVGVKFDEFSKKILSEGTKLIERMKQYGDTKMDITTEMIKFVSQTSARCFIDYEMTPEFYQALTSFTKLLNMIVVSTYFFPVWLLNLIYRSKLRSYRRKMTSLLRPIIEEYRQDKNKSTSSVLRAAVDYVDEKGCQLSNDEVGDVVVCLLYVSSENTALDLSATMIDLINHPEIWNQIKIETAGIIDDAKAITESKLLNACVMESARMNTHLFALMRRPMAMTSFAGYDISGVDGIALCEPILMIHDCSHDKFSDPTVYNPYRLITNSERQGEPCDSKSVITWGAGVHLCPGKSFAMYEIKIAAALIVNNFERPILTKEEIGELNYFSPSAFAERKAKISFIPLTNKYNIIRLDGCWLFKNYLSLEEQEDYYYDIFKSINSNDVRINFSRPYPLMYYNLIYTQKSNCEYPTKWINLANVVWQELLKDPTFDGNKNYKFDSVYAQMYPPNAGMNKHKDQHVNWGVSISLGGSCEFIFNNQTINLESGDIIVADFSKYDHEVLSIINPKYPAWFKNTDAGSRCSVQIRCLPEIRPPAMSMENFTKLINN